MFWIRWPAEYFWLWLLNLNYPAFTKLSYPLDWTELILECSLCIVIYIIQWPGLWKQRLKDKRHRLKYLKYPDAIHFIVRTWCSIYVCLGVCTLKFFVFLNVGCIFFIFKFQSVSFKNFGDRHKQEVQRTRFLFTTSSGAKKINLKKSLFQSATRVPCSHVLQQDSGSDRIYFDENMME